MKSLNDILWNKDVEIGEEGKTNEYQSMGEPPMITDNCSCCYSGDPLYGGWPKFC
ncbi:hypothetical protein NE686_22105 [Tissierella carlieri]|uniref:Uncharacterized protein n=1 Tax=Tissierella carlieri TaxID=689904 RepID=A0ABT1SIK6_9FIRM|nr:hypothetical protein [Tissierella carlieri]MCQ4925802.1 hypothetical protein [Tissierella carlieri]